MLEAPIVAYDVGGTSFRWADWSSTYGLGPIRRYPSPSVSMFPSTDIPTLREYLVRAIANPVPPGGMAGVSFGAALDHRSGTVYASAPLWGAFSDPFDLGRSLTAARPDVRWRVVNDVTAALLHFAQSVSKPGLRKIFLATISTGIACRMIDQRTGEIAVDGCGLQGEIGHLPATVVHDGEPLLLTCDCGVPGHVAAFSSGPGIRRLGAALQARDAQSWNVSAVGRRLTQGEAFETALLAALEERDDVAIQLLDAATEPIAHIVRTALCLDPEIDLVALTGGVAVSLGDHYQASLLGHLRREGLYLTSDRMPGWVTSRVHVCKPGEATGLIGAALAARSSN